MKKYKNVFAQMTSAESLFDSWNLFKKGKRQRRDVQEFERHLEKNIFRLHRDLVSKKYKHSGYASFFIQDPKVRHIRKACVRDRLVHQAVYAVLVKIFDLKFINDLYSSRIGKGTHRAVNALKAASLKVSRNYTRPYWSLKCDIRKFYDSVDHEILLSLLGDAVRDENAMWLLREVVHSFHVEGHPGKGTPIGNLTSQIFTGIYLNQLDQFVKHELGMRYYLRYADDFIMLSHDKNCLETLLPKIQAFLKEKLLLELHPDKISLRPLHQGIDFLGYVILPHHRVLRTKTKRRMKRKLTQKLEMYFEGAITKDSFNQTMQSYLGMSSHADTYELRQEVRNAFCWK